MTIHDVVGGNGAIAGLWVANVTNSRHVDGDGGGGGGGGGGGHHHQEEQEEQKKSDEHSFGVGGRGEIWVGWVTWLFAAVQKCSNY